MGACLLMLHIHEKFGAAVCYAVGFDASAWCPYLYHLLLGSECTAHAWLIGALFMYVFKL